MPYNKESISSFLKILEERAKAADQSFQDLVTLPSVHGFLSPNPSYYGSRYATNKFIFYPNANETEIFRRTFVDPVTVPYQWVTSSENSAQAISRACSMTAQLVQDGVFASSTPLAIAKGGESAFVVKQISDALEKNGTYETFGQPMIYDYIGNFTSQFLKNQEKQDAVTFMNQFALQVMEDVGLDEFAEFFTNATQAFRAASKNISTFDGINATLKNESPTHSMIIKFRGPKSGIGHLCWKPPINTNENKGSFKKFFDSIFTKSNPSNQTKPNFPNRGGAQLIVNLDDLSQDNNQNFWKFIWKSRKKILHIIIISGLCIIVFKKLKFLKKFCRRIKKFFNHPFFKSPVVKIARRTGYFFWTIAKFS